MLAPATVFNGRSRDSANAPSSLLPCSALARLRALVSPDGARSVAPAPVSNGRSRDSANAASSLLPCSALGCLRALVSPDGARSVASAPGWGLTGLPGGVWVGRPRVDIDFVTVCR
ncbi:hypothetical protein GCM10027436_08470 [Actinophytocola sediminis]